MPPPAHAAQFLRPLASGISGVGSIRAFDLSPVTGSGGIYLGAQQVRLKKDVADLARSPTPLAARRPASDIGRSRRTLNQPGHSRQSSGAWLQQEEERSRSDMATTWISSGGLSGHWDVESRTGHPINARAIAQFHGLHISVL
jgi:hypothetical protein